MFREFLLAFIPIFVAVDAIGVLPIFISLTKGSSKKERTKILVSSMVTATCLAVVFIFLGKKIFNFLGIGVFDFMIAGGAILFAIAIKDLLNPEKRKHTDSDMGTVPLGTPLIVGPAVLTTSLIVMDQYGVPITLLSVLINVLLAGLIFSASDFLIKILGESGSKAMSKITSLLLAAIAVMMVRKGIFLLLASKPL